MVIPDMSIANRGIYEIGYFRFKKFATPFQIIEGSDFYFKQNTIYQDVVDIYNFDSLLRVFVFEAISHLEISIKSLLNYCLTATHGTHWYLEKNVFLSKFTTGDNKNYKSKYDIFLENLARECSESKDRYVRKYMSEYTEPEFPPSWIIMETISFGTASILYQNIENNNLKRQVSNSFGTEPLFFNTWLNSLSYLRNQCAHHQKISKKTFKFPPKLPKRETLKFFEQLREDSLYNVLCVIQFMLSKINIWCDFSHNIKELISNNPQIDLNELGFPNNWLEEPIWK
jgi:abortive infection bacteriophage resistance protein